jgi:REP element-mobilizing transposase RayT
MPRTYTQLHCQVVFSTKDRRPWLTPPVREELYRFGGEITAETGGVLHSIVGIADRVHLLAGLKPTMALTTFVQRAKGISSRWLNESEKIASSFFWQKGFGAFTVSASQMGIVRNISKPRSSTTEKCHTTVR